ncbi:MAG: HAD family hydrolase [Candidatus Obscuribacterales bacterium]|nr:HAD family hydrolase [Candidatus Obscuribacterales bacterium]
MTSKPQGRPVVYLDRDGTLNVEDGYIRQLERLVLIAGAAQAVRRLNEAGVAAILITNQSGAARGYYPESHILDLNNRLVSLLEKEGAYLDAVYYCPHLPDGTVAEYTGNCKCRKPEIGLVERACSDDTTLDKNRSYVVGDKSTDVELAHNIGGKGVLVRTGYGEQVLDGTYQWPVKPDYIASEITEAIDWILADLKVKTTA